jgi:nitrogen fixation/metabolism regulation signal transduction histidine kinase
MSTTTQADLQAELKSLRARVAESECERGRSSDVELPQVRELLDLVMAHAPVVLWSVDQDGVFTISQGKGLEVLGLHAGEAVGQSVFDMYRNVPQVITDVRRAMAGEEFQSTVEVGELYFET